MDVPDADGFALQEFRFRVSSCTDQGWKVRSATDRTIRIFHIRIPVKFCQNSGIFFTILQKFWKCWDFSTFSRIFGEIRRKIIKIWTIFDENCRKIMIFFGNSNKNSKKFDEFLRIFWIGSGAKVCLSCRSWKMLKDYYFVAKIGFDTEENEPSKVWSFSLKNTGFYWSDLSTKLYSPPGTQFVDPEGWRIHSRTRLK